MREATKKQVLGVARLKPYFVFGCISILIIVLALLIKKNLSPDRRYFFRILFALGCAGVAAVLPGISSLKYKGIVGASGAIVVFFLVLRIHPQDSRFNITVFPKNEFRDLINLSAGCLTRLNTTPLNGPWMSPHS